MTSEAVPITAGAVMAGTPFLGLINRLPITKDPFINEKITRLGLEELSRLARTGDVILASKGYGSGIKTMNLSSGSEFYHAQPVVGMQGGKGVTIYPGELAAEDFLRNLATPEEILRYKKLETLAALARNRGYTDVLLMRPKVPMTSLQKKMFTTEALRMAQKDYSGSRAVKNWLRDLFLPNLSSTRAPELICEEGICSTAAANAFAKATGKPVVPGLASVNTMPRDFMVEKSLYEPVAAYVSKGGLTRAALRNRGLLVRGGLGALMGLGTYGTIEDPTLIPAFPAFAFAPNIAKALGTNKFPTYEHLLHVIKEPTVESILAKKRFLTRSIPLSVGAAVASVLLTKLIASQFGDKPKTD